MHLPHHYRGHVERLGALGAYSTESGESAHRQQIKDGYHHSNRHNYSQQIIEYYTRISALAMREQNVKQLAKEGFYIRDVADTLSLLSASGKLNLLLYITKLTYSLTTDRRLRNKHNRTATHRLKALEYTLQLPENECLSLTFPMRKLASRVDCIHTLSDIQWLCNLPDLPHFLREY